jgi:hypothetical protein
MNDGESAQIVLVGSGMARSAAPLSHIDCVATRKDPRDPASRRCPPTHRRSDGQTRPSSPRFPQRAGPRDLDIRCIPTAIPRSVSQSNSCSASRYGAWRQRAVGTGQRLRDRPDRTALESRRAPLPSTHVHQPARGPAFAPRAGRPNPVPASQRARPRGWKERSALNKAQPASALAPSRGTPEGRPS